MDWILPQQSQEARSCPPHLPRTVRGSPSAARSKARVPLRLGARSGIQSAEVSGSSEHYGWGNLGLFALAFGRSGGDLGHLPGGGDAWEERYYR